MEKTSQQFLLFIINMVILQRYSNQNPVSKILLCNSKWFKQTKTRLSFTIIDLFLNYSPPSRFQIQLQEKYPAMWPPSVLSSMYKIHPYTSCGLESHDHKWKLQERETPRGREGNRCSWLRVTQRIHSESRHSRRGTQVHFPSCCRHRWSRVDHNQAKTFLIPIWKIQVFLHLHERGLTWFKILLANCFAPSWLFPFRCLKRQNHFQQDKLGTTHFTVFLPHCLPRQGALLNPFVSQHYIKGGVGLVWFAFLSTLCAPEQAASAQSNPFPVWLGYAHLKQWLFLLCTLVSWHLAAVFSKMWTSSNQCGRKTKAKAYTGPGNHRAEQKSCIMEDDLERAFFGFLLAF